MAKINWVTEKDLEEKEKREEEKVSIQQAKEFLMEKMLEKYVLSEDLPEEELEQVMMMYPEWTVGHSYTVGEKLRYNGSVMEVVQDHTSQEDWKPDQVPALYKVFRQMVTEDNTPIVEQWVQPTGGHDAYGIGSKVQYNGKVYESTVDGNIWSPVDYPSGWKEV